MTTLNEKYEKYIDIDKDILKTLLPKRRHIRFMQYCWQNPANPFLVGMHTKEIGRRIDIAFDRLRKNQSSFLLIKVPFRHGKSDIVSRYLPPHFLGEFPNSEVMVVSYSSGLSEDFSRFARSLMRSDKYKQLYPDINLDPKNSGVQKWGIEGKLGRCVASGLSSGLTGKGYHLGILDDYCASRADAESEVIRNGAWEHFTNDFFTRRAPVSITIVLATPWHVDDIIGRILKKIDPNNEQYDEEFPKFEVLSFPAMNGDVEVYDEKEKKYIKKHYDFLFPERFSSDWYKQQSASLGTYGTASLMQCNPQVRGGKMLQVDKVKVHTSLDDFPKTKYVRVWDMAHSAKQRLKDDPDYTSGTLLTYIKRNGVWELWIKDVARMRGEAPERDLFINAVTEKDGNGVQLVISKSVDSIDMYNTLKGILTGRRIVHPVFPRGDKVARISPVEPVFEAGNVHILSAPWNLDWITEMTDFPSGSHDDQVDNLSDGYEFFNKAKSLVYAGTKGV